MTTQAIAFQRTGPWVERNRGDAKEIILANAAAKPAHDQLYAEYTWLHDAFVRDPHGTMKVLKQLNRPAVEPMLSRSHAIALRGAGRVWAARSTLRSLRT